MTSKDGVGELVIASGMESAVLTALVAFSAHGVRFRSGAMAEGADERNHCLQGAHEVSPFLMRS